MTWRLNTVRTLVIAAMLAGQLACTGVAAEVTLPSATSQAAPGPREIERLLAEAHALEGNDIQQSLQTALQALKQAHAQRSATSELASLLQVGKSMRLVNDYPGALRVAQEGMLLAERLKDDATRGELLLLRGTIEWNQAKIPEATVSMMEALRLGETLGNQRLQLGVQMGLGLVRARSDDIEGALPHLETALRLAEKIGDDRLGSVLNDIGNLYLQRKDYPRAQEYFERALAALQPVNNQRTTAYVLLNLGQVYTETGDQEKAGQYLNESMAICRHFQLRRGMADVYYLLAARSRRLGRFDEALQSLDQSQDIARTLSNPDLFVLIDQEYIQTAEARGDFQGALKYTQQLATQLEIVRGEKARRESTEIQARYEAEGRNRQIKLLQRDHELQEASIALKTAELSQARMRYLGLAIVLIFGSVSAAAVVKTQRARASLAAHLLAETRVAKEEIEAADARKARLLAIAARELSESEVRFRCAFEFSPLGIAVVGLRGQWLRVNPALCKIIGYEEDELLAIDFQAITHPDDLTADTVLLGQLMAGEIDSYHLEKRYLCKDGQVIWVRLDVSLVRDPSTGDPHYFIAQVQDIGERRRAQEQLRSAKEEAERANEAKNEFLSRMSHELRTPLNAILGFAQLLELEDFGERQNQSVTHILGAGRHLLELINEVLDISQIESGHFSFACEPTPVKASLCSAVDLLRPLAERAGVEIVAPWEEIDAEWHVQADPRRLKQVLLNLLSNAIKYNRPHGQVYVHCREEGNCVQIEIRDTGVGIAADDLAKVFEPFTRLPATARVPGTGLGLSLSKGLTEAMGGHLTVRSEIGQGSTFVLELMRSPVDQDTCDVEALLQMI